MQCPQCGYQNQDDQTLCAQCGAPLDQAAKSKAKKDSGGTAALTCSKCGSSNITKSYKVIGSGEDAETVGIAQCAACGTKFDKDHPIYYQFYAKRFKPRGLDSPLKLGLKGKLGDAEYQIMGRIRYQDEDEYDVETWDEWYLVSQFGDRGWLVAEKGKFFLYSKYKPKQELAFEEKQVRFDGMTIPRNKGYIARIAFTEGELPWQAELGESTWCYDFKKDGTKFCIEQSEEEAEVYSSERIKAGDLFRAFGLKEYEQKFERSLAKRKRYAASSRIYLLMMLLAFGFGIYNCSQGKLAYKFTPSRDLKRPLKHDGKYNYFPKKERPYKIHSLTAKKVRYGPIRLEKDTTKILGLEVALTKHRLVLRSYRLNREWLEASAELTDGPEKKAKEVFGIENASFWHETGYDSDGYWSESDLFDDAGFIVTETKDYYLTIEVSAQKPRRYWTYVGFEIHKDERSSEYLVWTGILFMIFFIVTRVRSKSHSEFPFPIQF